MFFFCYGLHAYLTELPGRTLALLSNSYATAFWYGLEQSNEYLRDAADRRPAGRRGEHFVTLHPFEEACYGEDGGGGGGQGGVLDSMHGLLITLSYRVIR